MVVFFPSQFHHIIKFVTEFGIFGFVNYWRIITKLHVKGILLATGDFQPCIVNQCLDFELILSQ